MSLSEDGKPAVQKHSRKREITSWLIGIIMLAILGVFIGVRLADNVARSVKVPPNIEQSYKTPIYLPEKLPGNYKTIEDSFTLQEEVLIFQAKDGAGGTIVFTEQPKPKDVNFEDFYAQQFKDAETLDNVPYPSVTGKSSANNSSVLSIVTDEVWIIASSRSPISAGDLEILAKSIKPYDAQ